MSKKDKAALNSSTAPAETPIVAQAQDQASTAKTYTLRLPPITRERPATYICAKGPMGVERWLAKDKYTIGKDEKGLYATLTQSQADYYFKSLPKDCAYMPIENKAEG